jgi:GNAT superfamily N-acetyltransferase
MQMNFTIREAQENDAGQLSEIALEAKRFWDYPDDWLKLWADIFTITPEFIRKHKVLVAADNSSLLGFIAISINAENAEVEHMWVLPEYVKNGIGKNLLNEVIKLCRSNHIKKIIIESDPNAKGFYEKMGAKHIGYVDSIPKPRKLPVLEIDL